MDRMGKAALNIRNIILGRRALQCVLAFVLCFAMLAGSLPAVNARAEGGNGGDRTIAVKFPASYVSAAVGETLALYQVGPYDNGDIKLYDDFGIDPITEQNKTTFVKEKLETWCAEPTRQPVSTATIEAGKTEYVFSNLQLGAYLLMLEGNSHPTLNMNSSLISLLENLVGDKAVEAKVEPAIQVEVEKVWNDNNNAFGIRPDPEEITVELVKMVDGKNPTPYPDANTARVTLNENNGWKASRGNLPTGTGVTYAWREYVPEGYTATNEPKKDNEGKIIPNSFVITNTPKTTSVSVTKVWVDNNDAAGKRPNEVKVQLLADDQPLVPDVVKTLVPQDGGKWSTETVSGLPVYKKEAGQLVEIKYTWKELDPGDYSVTLDPAVVSGETTQTITVTNQYPPVKSATIIKDWDDNNNQDGIRPSELTVTLLQNGKDYNGGTTVTLNEKNRWSATITNLPAYDGEQNPYKYTWQEEDVNEKIKDKLKAIGAGYTLSNTEVKTEGETTTTTITNTHTPETVELNIAKQWVDGAGNSIQVSDVTEIKIQLMATNEIYETIPLKNEQGYVFTGFANTIFTGAKVERTGDWAWKITNLPRRNGTEADLHYLITEVESDKIGLYSDGKDYYFDEKTNTVRNEEDGIYTITNHKLERTKIIVEKKWEDWNNLYGTRPDSITIRLIREDTKEETTKTVTPDANGDWKCEFANLLKYTEGGQEIIYTVSEIVPAHYEDSEEYPKTVSSKTDQDDTYVTISNRYPNGNLTIQKTVTINSTEVTDDASVIGTYYFKVEGPIGAVNPMSTVVPIAITPGGVGDVTLYELAQGVYHIEEVMPLPDNVTLTQGTGGYDIEVKANGAAAPSPTPPVAAFVNNIEVTPSPSPTPTPEPTPTTSISGQKVWDDNGNENGVRPSSIDVRLYDNNNNVVNAAPSWGPTDGDVWSYSFSNLPAMTEEGEPITYTVVETPVEYYTSTVAGTTITNSLIPKTPEEYTNIEGAKTWNDGGNAYGIRPAYISVTLLQDGVPIASATVTAATNWQYRFENLPVDDGYGHIYEYTVSEVTVPGYYTVTNGSSIINGFIPDEPPEEPDEPPEEPEEPPRYRTPPEFEEKTEEELEELIDLFEYDTPLFGRPLGTGDDIPVYPFIFAGIGLAAVLVLLVSRRRGKNEG